LGHLISKGVATDPTKVEAIYGELAATQEYQSKRRVTELLPGFRAHYEGYDWAQEVLQKHATGKLSDNSITVVV
jgi:hypothetical protein